MRDKGIPLNDDKGTRYIVGDSSECGYFLRFTRRVDGRLFSTNYYHISNEFANADRDRAYGKYESELQWEIDRWKKKQGAKNV